MSPWCIRIDKRASIGFETNKNAKILMKALAARLSDSQTNLRPRAANAMAALAKGLGPSVASLTNAVMRVSLALLMSLYATQFELARRCCRIFFLVPQTRGK